MTRKFLDCNAKVEDILRCGQTGIKLKRKEDADVGLLSGDESEASPNPAVREGDDGDNDETESDEILKTVAEALPRQGAGLSAVSLPVASGFSMNVFSAESRYPSTSSSPTVPSSLIGVGNLTRSPIKLRLRQMAPPERDDADSDDVRADISRVVSANNGDEKEGNDKTDSKCYDDGNIEDDVVLPSDSTRGKGGKSSNVKRKGKASAPGLKRKKLEKEYTAAEACEKDAIYNSSSLTAQRKRPKM